MAFTGTVGDPTSGGTALASWAATNWSDPLQALTGAPDTWTPTLSQGASTNIAKTVTMAKYWQVGKLVLCQVKLVPTASGTAGSAVTVTLPVTAAYGTSIAMAGIGGYYDADGTDYVCSVNISSTTTFTLLRDGLLSIGVDPSVAVTATDGLYAAFFYEAA